MVRWMPLVFSLALACGSGPSSADGPPDSTDDVGSGSSGTEGSATGTGESSGSEDSGATEETGDGPGCDDVALAACVEAAAAEYDECASPCPEPPPCDALTCLARCRGQRATAEWDCGQDHCSRPPDGQSPCEQECSVGADECFGGLDCDPHGCTLAVAGCDWICGGCSPAELDYAYEGSCTVALPPGLSPRQLPFIELELDGVDFNVGVEGDPACDNPGVGASIEGPELDQLVLCPEQCDSYVELGILRVKVSIPCGP